jgi:hypothetical protein
MSDFHSESENDPLDDESKRRKYMETMDAIYSDSDDELTEALDVLRRDHSNVLDYKILREIDTWSVFHTLCHNLDIFDVLFPEGEEEFVEYALERVKTRIPPKILENP